MPTDAHTNHFLRSPPSPVAFISNGHEGPLGAGGSERKAIIARLQTCLMHPVNRQSAHDSPNLVASVELELSEFARTIGASRAAKTRSMIARSFSGTSAVSGGSGKSSGRYQVAFLLPNGESKLIILVDLVTALLNSPEHSI